MHDGRSKPADYPGQGGRIEEVSLTDLTEYMPSCLCPLDRILPSALTASEVALKWFSWCSNTVCLCSASICSWLAYCLNLAGRYSAYGLSPSMAANSRALYFDLVRPFRLTILDLGLAKSRLWRLNLHVSLSLCLVFRFFDRLQSLSNRIQVDDPSVAAVLSIEGPKAIATADLDKDGTADFAVSNSDGTITVLWGDPDPGRE